jgi:hypothetical protein
MSDPDVKPGRPRPQVNIGGLTEHELRVLDALAYLHQGSRRSPVLLPVVREFLRQHEDDPDVQQVLHAQENED